MHDAGERLVSGLVGDHELGKKGVELVALEQLHRLLYLGEVLLAGLVGGRRLARGDLGLGLGLGPGTVDGDRFGLGEGLAREVLHLGVALLGLGQLGLLEGTAQQVPEGDRVLRSPGAGKVQRGDGVAEGEERHHDGGGWPDLGHHRARDARRRRFLGGRAVGGLAVQLAHLHPI